MIYELPDPDAPLETLAAQFARWLRDNADAISASQLTPTGDLDAVIAHGLRLQNLLWDDGWTRLGWNPEFGGLGGSVIKRAYIMDQLSAAGYVQPEGISTAEIVGATLVKLRPDLAEVHIPRGVRGDEIWCQGFSEPDAGSDLAGLRTRAVLDGNEYVINGQKMWSTSAHLAQWSMLLARTGDVDSRHRGITAFWVPMDAPGLTVAPTELEHGRRETAEIFLEDVRVPAHQVIGEVNGGWDAVMYLMQYERGAYAWGRQSEFHRQLERLVADYGSSFGPDGDRLVGEAYLAMTALRSQSGQSIRRLAVGETLGPEISVDKLLLGAAEQSITDVAHDLLWPQLEIGDSIHDEVWRSRWSFARVTTIYGGAAEVQRDILGERILGLPKGR